MGGRSPFLERLEQARREHRFPHDLRTGAADFTQSVLALLFPHFVRGKPKAEVCSSELDHIAETLGHLQQALQHHGDVVPLFVDALEGVWDALRDDADALFQGDPAARSVDEIILAYPGFYATASYRIAHVLYTAGLPIIPRLIAELAHEKTGVDIHPGARIARRFMIDHGTGVVVGETAIIGNGVKLYQGVTLGALTVDKRQTDAKRHPTIGDHVVVYSNATILGGDTHIGHDSIIAGNAFITQSVPPFSVVNRRGDARPRESEVDASIDFVI